jgi:energy-coupling factor transporter transmembrane protein EcfT
LLGNFELFAISFFLILCLILSAVFLCFFASPFVYIGAVFCAYFAFCSKKMKKTKVKNLSLSLFVICFLLVLAELFMCLYQGNSLGLGANDLAQLKKNFVDFANNEPDDGYYLTLDEPKDFYSKAMSIDFENGGEKEFINLLKDKKNSIKDKKCWGDKCYGNGLPAKYNKELGAKGFPYALTRTQRIKDEKAIYDVLYFNNDEGFRYVPRSANSLKNYVFLGGSFTYGEGLENWQTIPYVFSKLNGFSANVLDYSYSGFGPHHVLKHIQLEECSSKQKAFEVFDLHHHQLLACPL